MNANPVLSAGFAVLNAVRTVICLKLKKLFLQLVRFGFVGAVAAVIDIGILVLLSEKLGVDVLAASAVSFSVSVIVNYILSMKFVFEGRSESRFKEFIVFTVLSIGGLCINQGIMWLGTEIMNIYYLAVKLFAMVFVPVYNFITRKIFLEKKG